MPTKPPKPSIVAFQNSSSWLLTQSPWKFFFTFLFCVKIRMCLTYFCPLKLRLAVRVVCPVQLSLVPSCPTKDPSWSLKLIPWRGKLKVYSSKMFIAQSEYPPECLYIFLFNAFEENAKWSKFKTAHCSNDNENYFRHAWWFRHASNTEMSFH